MINRVAVDIPEQELGSFKIKHRNKKYGLETILIHNKQHIMSDRPSEFEEHGPLFSETLRGNILVTGLGISYVHNKLLSSPEVKRVIILEKYPEVIGLVWPYCKKDDRFEVICYDSDDWEPTLHFDLAWMDSWTEHHSVPQELWWKKTEEKYSSHCDKIMFWKPTKLMNGG